MKPPINWEDYEECTKDEYWASENTVRIEYAQGSIIKHYRLKQKKPKRCSKCGQELK